MGNILARCFAIAILTSNIYHCKTTLEFGGGGGGGAEIIDFLTVPHAPASALFSFSPFLPPNSCLTTQGRDDQKCRKLS